MPMTDDERAKVDAIRQRWINRAPIRRAPT